MIIKQNSRIGLHRITDSGTVFTVPSNEDFTLGTWLVTDLCMGEIGINLADDRAFMRTLNGIVELQTSSITSALWIRTGEDIQAVENGLTSPLIYPNILPPADDVSDLGSSTLRWKDLYLGSVINFTTDLDFQCDSLGTNIAQFKPGEIYFATNDVTTFDEGYFSMRGGPVYGSDTVIRLNGTSNNGVRQLQLFINSAPGGGINLNAADTNFDYSFNLNLGGTSLWRATNASTFTESYIEHDITGEALLTLSAINAANTNILKIIFDSDAGLLTHTVTTGADTSNIFFDGSHIDLNTPVVIMNGTQSANVATGIDSCAQGSGTTASGDSSHAEGDGTQATSIACHAEGVNTIASNTAAHAEGGSTQATATYSHAEGLSTLASSNAAHAEGSGTEATNDAAHAEGSGTEASGVSSHAEGADTIASGSSSHAGGINAVADHYAEWARGSNTNTGASQYGIVSFNRRTTNDSGVEMFLNGTFSGAGSNRFTIASNTCYYLRIYVTGVIESTGETTTFFGTGTIKNVGGTTSLESAISMDVVQQNAALSLSDCDAAADDTNDSLLITVTGLVGTNIRWTCRVDYEKIAF